MIICYAAAGGVVAVIVAVAAAVAAVVGGIVHGAPHHKQHNTIVCSNLYDGATTNEPSTKQARKSLISYEAFDALVAVVAGNFRPLCSCSTY